MAPEEDIETRDGETRQQRVCFTHNLELAQLADIRGQHFKVVVAEIERTESGCDAHTHTQHIQDPFSHLICATLYLIVIFLFLITLV